MEKVTTEKLVLDIRTWAMNKFDEIEFDKSLGDANAVYQEFAEWLEPQEDELEIVSLDEITPDEFEKFQEQT